MEAELLAGGLNSSPSGGATRGWWGFFQLPRYTPGKDTTLMRIDGHAFDRTWFHITLQDSRGCVKYYWLLPAHDFDLANAHRSHSLINYKEEIASKESDFLGTKCPCMYICIYFLHRRYRPKVSVGEWSPKLGSDFTPTRTGEGLSATDNWYTHYNQNATDSQVLMSKSILLQTRRKGE